MEIFLIIIASLTLMYLLFLSIEFTIGFGKIKNLTDQAEINADQMPLISVIFTALNEEKEIENALNSLLNLNYPRLEIIAINDRSTDKTAKILDHLASQHPKLRVYHINHLPEDWFGKNHALHFASRYAKGEWLLFTDADVVMKSATLSKAISYVVENKLDHLTIFEHHLRKDFWLKVAFLGNYMTYSLVMKPWRICYSWSKNAIGHGAFNLVKKSAYQQCGGHQSIALECLDDMKLGELLKINGFRQDTVDGRDFIEREWYSSLKEMIYGLEKNGFAYHNYQLLSTVRDCIFAILFYIWPIIGAIIFAGPVRYLNIINIFLTLYTTICVAEHFRLQKRYVFSYPISIVILLYTILSSVVSVYKNKGVIWRGTYYPLKKIKSKKSLRYRYKNAVATQIPYR